MSGFERGLLCSALLLVLLAICIIPAPASAEPLLLLHTTHNPAPPVRADRQEMSIGLNDQGDMVIQHGPLALIVASLSSEIPDIPEQHGMAQKQETLAASGISVRFNLSF